MGLDGASVKFLCGARSAGVDFTRTLTIGRQELVPEADSLNRVFRTLGIEQDAERFLQQNNYGEGFFELLGAEQVTSVDYSPYENADIIHDLNLPVPETLHERFSVVYDGGTLEHVFNVPQALKSCMEMVAVDGHFTQANVANNLMGHGFWQFSPELIFRTFSTANGYKIEVVLLHELVVGGRWYVVSDPEVMLGRVGLCNSVPTYILTIAKRVSRTPIFAVPPFQSDYVTTWNEVSGTRARDTSPKTTQSARVALAGLRRHIPNPVKRMIRAMIGLRRMGGNGFEQACYRQIEEEALLHGSF